MRLRRLRLSGSFVPCWKAGQHPHRSDPVRPLRHFVPRRLCPPRASRSSRAIAGSLAIVRSEYPPVERVLRRAVTSRRFCSATITCGPTSRPSPAVGGRELPVAEPLGAELVYRAHPSGYSVFVAVSAQVGVGNLTRFDDFKGVTAVGLHSVVPVPEVAGRAGGPSHLFEYGHHSITTDPLAREQI